MSQKILRSTEQLSKEPFLKRHSDWQPSHVNMYVCVQEMNLSQKLLDIFHQSKASQVNLSKEYQ